MKRFLILAVALLMGAVSCDFDYDLSNSEKLNVSSQMLDRGIMSINDVREIWNLPPIPDGNGKEYVIRGEYMNADEKVNTGSKGNSKDDDDNEEDKEEEE